MPDMLIVFVVATMIIVILCIFFCEEERGKSVLILSMLISISMNWLIAYWCSPIVHIKESIIDMCETEGIQFCVIDDKLINLSEHLNRHFECDKIICQKRIDTYFGIWDMTKGNYDLIIVNNNNQIAKFNIYRVDEKFYVR